MRFAPFHIIVLFSAWLLPAEKTHAQQTPVDSLKNIFTHAKNDTVRIKALKAWDDLIYMSDADLDFALNKRIDSLCNICLKRKKINREEKHFYLFSKGSALNNMGLYYKQRNEFDKAIPYFENSIKIRKKAKDLVGAFGAEYNVSNTLVLKGEYDKALERCLSMLNGLIKIKHYELLGSTYNSIGAIYRGKGDVAKSLIYYNKALKLAQKLKDNVRMAVAFTNIGIAFKDQQMYKKALTHFFNALKLYPPKDKFRIANMYNYIGSTYIEIDPAKALKYLQMGLVLKKELGDKLGLLQLYGNIGMVHKRKADSLQTAGNKSLALRYYEIALQKQDSALVLSKGIGYTLGTAGILNNIAQIYLRKNNFEKAVFYGEQSLEVSKGAKFAIETKASAENLYAAYTELRKFDKALEMYELFIATSDSITREENQKELIKQEFKFQYEKKATADSVANAKQDEIKNAEISKQKAEIKAKQTQQYFLFGGMLIVVIFAGFMFNRFRVISRQKKLLAEQKMLVEEKQKEILDSIYYARRIQRALLPNEKYIAKALRKK